jgi:hypothetical protein
MKLTPPQKKALLYYQRAALPLSRRGRLPPPWRSAREPDPRVKWALTHKGVLTLKGLAWSLSREGAQLAEELWGTPP